MISPQYDFGTKNRRRAFWARPPTGNCFFSLSKSRIANYPYLPGNFSKFIFAFFAITYENFARFTPLTRFFPNRDDPLQQAYIEQNFAQQIQHDRNVGPNRSVCAMQQSRSRLLVVFLQNMSRDYLPRELIQPVQAGLHIVYEDHPIFKRHHGVRRHLRPKKLPSQQ